MITPFIIIIYNKLELFYRSERERKRGRQKKNEHKKNICSGAAINEDFCVYIYIYIVIAIS